MNKIVSTLLVAPVMFLGILPIGRAQAQANTSAIDALRDNLQTAVCLSEWDEALSIIGPMIGSSEISADYREELIRYRRQIQTWKDTQADLSSQSSCTSVVAAAEADAIAEADARADELQAAEAARQQAIASQSQVQQNTRSTGAQCTELAVPVNWVVGQARTLLAQTNFSDPSSIFGMLNQLSEVSSQAATSLQAIQLSDSQLQSYQRDLVASYRAYVPAIRTLLDSVNSGDVSTLQQQNLTIQQSAARELELMNQINAYCGGSVINLEAPAL
ncbi:MAG: hypothetical protein AAFR31_13160 [Cyanobacteria bacterium J06627_8]